MIYSSTSVTQAEGLFRGVGWSPLPSPLATFVSRANSSFIATCNYNVHLQGRASEFPEDGQKLQGEHPIFPLVIVFIVFGVARGRVGEKGVHCGNAAVVISDFLSHSLTPFMTWPASRCQSQRLVVLSGSIGDDPRFFSSLELGNIVKVVNQKRKCPAMTKTKPKRIGNVSQQ